jgi:uncharacterized RDD family membrane protein YckC
VERNRFAAPAAEVDDVDLPQMKCVGFWARASAYLIDVVILVAVSYPLLIAAYGFEYFNFASPRFRGGAGPVDILVSWVFPPVAIVLFWHYKQATPGKMVIGARVADASTGNRLSLGRCITRYLAFIIAALPLGLGLIWIAFDRRKQGWHDKITGSVVVRSRQTKARVEDVSPEVLYLPREGS